MKMLFRQSLSLSRCLAAAAALFAAVALGGAAHAQVVVLVNGAPITELDISQRTKLIQLSNNKNASRKEVLDDLINDHLKIFIAQRYGLDVSEADVNSAFAGMAQRARTTTAQMEQSLASRGVGLKNFKLRIKAEIGWGQLVRGKFGSTLQVGETDIRNALQSRGEEEKNTQGFVYTIYPIIFVGSNDELAAKRRDADALRARFKSCDEDLRLARSMREVVVKKSILRSSADLTPQLREMLDKMELGKLTPPEITPQGIQMFAVCERKANESDTPLKRQVREELFNKRYEAESKKFLDEIRRQAMIEYRQPQ